MRGSEHNHSDINRDNIIIRGLSWIAGQLLEGIERNQALTQIGNKAIELPVTPPDAKTPDNPLQTP